MPPFRYKFSTSSFNVGNWGERESFTEYLSLQYVVNEGFLFSVNVENVAVVFERLNWNAWRYLIHVLSGAILLFYGSCCVLFTLQPVETFVPSYVFMVLDAFYVPFWLVAP